MTSTTTTPTRLPEHVVRYLTETRGRKRTAELAAHFGVSEDTICKWRRRLYDAGLLQRQRRQLDLTRAAALLRSGLSVPLVAEALETTPDSLCAALYRRGMTVGEIRATAAAVWSLADVALLLGVPDTTPELWVRRGWLATYRSRPTPDGRRKRNPRSQGLHQITRAALIEFLRVKQAWMTYEPAHITDPELRRVAETFRAETPGRWWKTADIARALHYTPTRVATWTRETAWLDGWETVVLAKARWVWIPAGAPFPEPPPNRPYRHPQAKPERNAAIIAARDAGASPHELAAQYGINVVRVYEILRERKTSGLTVVQR